MPVLGVFGQIDVSHAMDIIGQFAKPTWAEVKWVFEFSVYFLACIAALGTLWRLGKIIELVRAITDGRSRIWDLRETVHSLQSTVEDMKSARGDIASVLNDFRDADIAGIVKAMQDQLAELQRETTDDSVSQSITAADPSARVNWQEIKDIWTDARKQIENIIENEDGRRTRRIRQMSRRDYKGIIKSLLDDYHLIDEAIARDATYMNDRYLSFRNQRNPITEDEKKEFMKRKQNFDSAVANFKPSPPSLPPISIPLASPNPVPNPRTNGHAQQPDVPLRDNVQQ